MRYVAKYFRARQATDDSVAHVHCMLENYCYQHTFRICNTCCFSGAKIVAQTCLSMTWYVHCLSWNCLYWLRLLHYFNCLICSGCGWPSVSM